MVMFVPDARIPAGRPLNEADLTEVEEPLTVTPRDVVLMLGFDPLDEPPADDGLAADAPSDQWAEHHHPRDANGKFAASAAQGAALHPDNFASPVTKQVLVKVHAKVAHAFAQPDQVAALTAAKLGTHFKYGKAHQYLDQLIQEQAWVQGKKQAAGQAVTQAHPKELYQHALDLVGKQPSSAKATALLNGITKNYLVHGHPATNASQLQPIANPDGAAEHLANMYLKHLQQATSGQPTKQPDVPPPDPALEAEFANFKLAAPPTPPPVAPPVKATPLKLGPKNQMLHANITEHLDQILPGNKPAVAQLLNQINALLGDYAPAGKTVDDLKPIASPQGMAQLKMNELVAGLQAQHGQGPAPTSVVQPHAYLSPQQVVLAAQIGAAKPTKARSTTEMTTADGQEVTAALQVSSADVPGTWYADVTAKLGGNHAHGAHADGPLNGILEAYQNVVRDQLPSAAAGAISSYQQTGYQSINKALAAIPPDPMPTTGHLATLKIALTKSVVPADLPVYRGINASLTSILGSQDLASAVGKAFVHKSFASVSRAVEKSVAFAGGETLLKFNVPAGAPTS